MNTETFDFTKLIHPISPDTFFAEYWEKKPLHLQRRDEGYYRDLLTHQDLDSIISNTDMRFPALKLVPRGKMGTLRPDAYATNWKHGNDVFNGVPDIDKVFAEYRSGASVTLPGLEQNWAPLRAFCMALENYLNHAARTNIYITAANSQGFPPHYDTHEIFVMQVAGRKRWSVYEPPLALPLVNQPFPSQPFARDYVPPEPLLEPELEQGDLLYLPRGYVHAAATSASFSVHITTGVTVYTWVDMAAEAFMSCMETERFRKALPPGFASDPALKQTLREELAGLIEEIQRSSDYDKLIDHFINRASANRLRPKGSFQCDVSVR